MDALDWALAAFLWACIAIFVVIAWVLLTQYSCGDGFVYFDNNNYQGCVPVDFVKENA